MKRRSFLGASAAAIAIPGSVFAVDAAQSRQMVELLVRDVNAVIASGASEARMVQEFGTILQRYADVPTIARYCLGVDARRASAAELAAYTTAFQSYIASKYGRRFREFVGGEIVVAEASNVKSWVEVETTVLLRGRSPFQMDWHVSDRSGSTAFFNFIIEGVNMLLTERAEIGAMLDRRRGSISGLIADMKAI
jgi:phospholipid transport system substrate-binding protein